MGCAAVYADIIEADSLKSMFKNEWEAFQETLEVEDITLDDFAQNLYYNDDNLVYHEDYEDDHPICVAITNLRTAFKEKTGWGTLSPGLTLYLGYHNHQDNGDIYDEVDGAYFSVDGMYQLTEAGQAFRKHVRRCQWVNFG
jgi:hypothetical protein